jgi:hypothetical protein
VTSVGPRPANGTAATSLPMTFNAAIAQVRTGHLMVRDAREWDALAIVLPCTARRGFHVWWVAIIASLHLVVVTIRNRADSPSVTGRDTNREYRASCDAFFTNAHSRSVRCASLPLPVAPVPACPGEARTFLSRTQRPLIPPVWTLLFSLPEQLPRLHPSYGMSGLAVRTAETTSRIPRAVAAASS